MLTAVSDGTLVYVESSSRDRIGSYGSRVKKKISEHSPSAPTASKVGPFSILKVPIALSLV